MATVRTTYPGNLALETDIWTLTCTEAKAMLPLLNASKGSYWERTLLKPYRRARRAHAETVTVYTAGFSSGEFSNVLYAAGCSMTA